MKTFNLITALSSLLVATTAFNANAFQAPDEVLLLTDFTKLASHELNRNIIIDKELKEEEVLIYGASDVKISSVFSAVLQANKLETEEKDNVIIIKRKKEVNYDFAINTYQLKRNSKTVVESLDDSFSWVGSEYGYSCSFGLENETTLTTMCPEELTPLLNERMLPLIGKRKQVLIKAHIIETTNASFLGIGMKYGLQSSNGGITYEINKGILGAAMESVSMSANLGVLDALIELSESESEIKTASRPSILIESGKEGEINAISQVPVITEIESDEDDSTTSNVEYKDVGVMLGVEAEVINDSEVQLTINGELSSVDEMQGTMYPTFKRSIISTTTTVKTGEMIALGGLITTTEVTEKSGIPLLRDIPLIGGIFGSEYEKEDKKELTIMLTAQIK
ncbi:type II secretion system protein GspD [Vibrio splendidus]